MNNLQMWVLIIGIWLLAGAVALHSLTGRYKWVDLKDEMSNLVDARYDTWTGHLEAESVSEKKIGRFSHYTSRAAKDVR